MTDNGFLGGLFDLNGDGKTDSSEFAACFAAFFSAVGDGEDEEDGESEDDEDE